MAGTATLVRRSPYQAASQQRAMLLNAQRTVPTLSQLRIRTICAWDSHFSLGSAQERNRDLDSTYLYSRDRSNR